MAHRLLFEVKHREITLNCTLIVPTQLSPNCEHLTKKTKKNGLPESFEGKECVLYLHSHTGSQMEGKVLLPFLLEAGLSVCLMDFGGSGLSTGKYVSLGWHEIEQAKSVILKLRKKYEFGKICL